MRILIRTGHRASARHWAGMLESDEVRIWLDPAEIPQDGRPDVIVTDRALPSELGPGTSSTESAAATVGVVRIGPLETGRSGANGGDPTEVRLPQDVTARELRLACRLLARIVRLQRRQQREAELCRRLTEESLTDPLTGLPNRRAWAHAVERRLAAAAGPPRPSPRRLCVAIFDLDHFKRVNDAHGHAIGDEVLRAAGRAISESLRRDDFVARLGGDEFGMLLWVPDASTAAAVVDRVRAALPSHPARTSTHAVAASAGYHVLPACEPNTTLPSPEAICAAADTALREAKRQGRDRTVGR